MAIRRSDLELYQGNDWAATVHVLNPDRSPADITGYTSKAQIRRQVADQAPTVAAEIQATVVSPDISLYLSHAQTSLLAGQYQWDLDVISPAGIVTTLLAGTVTVAQEVTRGGVDAAARQTLRHIAGA